MENLVLRYPCVCENILSNLDIQSLLRCRLVSKTLKNQVDNDKNLWMKIFSIYKKWVQYLCCDLFDGSWDQGNDYFQGFINNSLPQIMHHKG